VGTESNLMARRAVEALRSGVPNRDAVRHLPVFQGDITQRFTELLLEMRESSAADQYPPRSMIIDGGFGCGKSHLLEYLRHEALEHGCVCSHIVISKETPLWDSLKLLRSAAEAAALPGKAGRAVPEILFTQKTDTPQFAQLFQWAHQQTGIKDRIAPLLKIMDDLPAGAEDTLDKIAWEWSGYPMKVSDIRSALKEIGQNKEYQVGKIRNAELASHLWSFLPRLFRAAGYNGWIVLIDEVELMLRYTRLQRAKSYAQVAKLAGAAKDFRVYGLLPVFSRTDDFWTYAEEKLMDLSEIPEWLRGRGRPGDAEMARDAEAGMKLLRRAKRLRPVGRDELEELSERLRRLHSEAFGWDAPPPDARESLASRTVREHVKSWIATWDMMLLYPEYRSDIVVEAVVRDYAEDADLSREDDQTEVAPQEAD